MRASAVHFLPLLLSFTTAISPDYRPFIAPYIDPSYSFNEDPILELFRRQTNNCPIGYNSCSNLGQAGVCCSVTAICSADAANHVACCPTGASCTGTIGATGTATGTAAGGGFIFGSSTTSALSTSSRPSTTTAGAQITAPPASTVANAFFPFLYIPTTFQNAATCSSYYTSCQSEYSSCTASLGGGAANGVTVGGIGGGVTVQGATATASAASICSSLYNQGCYNLQLSNCPQFGTAAATGTGVVVGTSDARRGCERLAYGVGVGVAVGLAGQVLG